MAKKKKTKKAEADFSYEKDTKRTHRYTVGDYGEAISGTLYFKKGEDVPDKIILKKVA